MNVKRKLMLKCLSIMIVFSMSCSSSEWKYEHYLDLKPYETALKELIKANSEARKNNDPVLKQYPYSVRSTVDPGSAAGSAGGYAYHAYSFYESGQLKTDMCYYKRGYLKCPELNFIKRILRIRKHQKLQLLHIQQCRDHGIL